MGVISLLSVGVFAQNDEKTIQTAIKSGTEQEKLAAVRATDNLSADQQTAAQLLSALAEDATPEVRAAAVEKLNQYRKVPQARETILKAASDSEPQVRKAALKLLGRLRGQDTLDVLYSALLDKDADVRSAAITALGVQEDRNAAGKIAFLMEGADFDMKRVCLLALEKIRSPESVGPLSEQALGGDPVLAGIASRALGRIGTLQAQDALESVIKSTQSASVRGSAAAAIGRIDNERSVNILSSLRDSAEPELILGAVYGLSELTQREDARETLLKILKKGTDLPARIAAGNALCQTGDAKVLNAYAKIIGNDREDTDLKLAGLNCAAAKINDKAAKEILTEAVKSKDARVKEKAETLMPKTDKK